jgi:hypothetical protein
VSRTADPDFYVRHLFADPDWRQTFTDLGFHPSPGGINAAMECLHREDVR